LESLLCFCEVELTLREASGDNHNARDAHTTILRRFDTLFFRTSEPYTTTNLTTFDRSKSALHMSFKRVNSGDPLGSSSSATVLCRMVDKAAEKESAAVGWRQPMFALWSMAVVSVLVVLWS
jgi:hypothetical protein